MSGTLIPESERRDSVPNEPELVTDPIARAEAEAANGLRQFDCGKAAAHDFLERIANGALFRLRPSLILSLHREALRGISSYAGNYRPGDVKIEKSKHHPPGAHLVPELVEEMCDYVNENWEKTPLHLSAYVMWRLNWIHPFADGNGRTSRISSYVVMMVKSGSVLPGSPSIPDQIANDRSGYLPLSMRRTRPSCKARLMFRKWKSSSEICWRDSWQASTRQLAAGFPPA